MPTSHAAKLENLGGIPGSSSGQKIDVKYSVKETKGMTQANRARKGNKCKENKRLYNNRQCNHRWLVD